MRGLAAFPTKWHGREIWAIGFHHELPKRNLCRDISHGCAVLESDNPREGNEMVKTDNFIRLLDCATETVENAAQFSGVRLHEFESIVPRVALMDDDVQSEFHGQIELLFEQACLFRFVSAVVNALFDFFFGRILKRFGTSLEQLLVWKNSCFFVRQLDARQPMVIQSGLADSHDAWICSELA